MHLEFLISMLEFEKFNLFNVLLVLKDLTGNSILEFRVLPNKYFLNSIRAGLVSETEELYANVFYLN